MIKLACAFQCDEVKNTSYYKGSCCTIRDFNPTIENDQIIEGLNTTKINKIVFINFKYGNIPQKIFQTNLLITDLNITNGDLQNIQKNAFINAGALNFLIFTQNKIKELNETSFHGAKYLYKIDLRENLITSIDATAFHGLEFLSYLYLDSNRLETIDSNVFQPVKRLFKLTLSNNRIKLVHPNIVYGCYKLDHLDLSKNLISGRLVLQNKYNEICLINVAENRINSFELVAENCVTTRKLQLTVIARNNDLNNVTVSNNYNLSYLNVYDNQIESINFIVKDHCNISYINIGKNPLSTHHASVGLKNLENLKYLNLSLNNFNNLSTMFTNLPELEILDLSNVILVQPLELKSLQNLKNLEMLDMSNLNVNGVSQVDLKNAVKRVLPNLKCLKYNHTNGWICEAPHNDETFDSNERPMLINIKITSNDVPLWMKVSFISSIVVLVLVCIFAVCVRKQRQHPRQHQVINNINVGSTTTELEML